MLIRRFGATPRGFHGQRIESIAFDGTGRWLLVASQGALALWTASSLERVVLLSSEHCIGDVVIFRDLAVATQRGGIRFWRVPTGEPAGEIELPSTRRDMSAILSPGGTAALRTDAGVEIWDLAAREHRGLFPWPDSALVNSAALTRDGRRLVMSNNQIVEVWEIAERKRIASKARDPEDKGIFPLGDGLRALSSRRINRDGSPARDRFAGVVAIDEIAIDQPPGPPVRRLCINGETGEFVESPDGTIASRFGRHQFAVWRPGSAQPATTAPTQERFTLARALSPDGSVLVTGDIDGWLLRWDTATMEALDRRAELVEIGRGMRGTREAVVALGRSSDAGRVIAVNQNGDATVWNLAEGVATATGHTGGRVLFASGAGEGFLTVHDARADRPPYAGGLVCRLWSSSLAPIGELRTPPVLAVAPDGSGLVAHATGAHVEVIALPMLETRRTFDLPAAVSALSFSPDAHALAWSIPGGPGPYDLPDRMRPIVGVTNLASGETLHQMGQLPHQDPIRALHLAADVRFCVAEGLLFQIDTREQCREVGGRDGHLEFAPGPLQTASSLRDKPEFSVRDPSSTLRARSFDHGAQIRSLCWIDVNRVAVGGEDGTFTLWDVSAPASS